MIQPTRIGTSLLLSLLLVAAPASSQATTDGGGMTSGTVVKKPGGNCGDFSTTGEPACNGTSEPVEATVCKTTTVQVKLGSKFVSLSVSQGGQTCYTKTLKPGECMAIQYNFECCKSFFFGWECESEGTTVVSG